MLSSTRLATRIRSTTSQQLHIIKRASCYEAGAPSGAQPRKRRFSDIATGFRIETPMVSFTPTLPHHRPEGYDQKDYKPNDERTLKLGKSKWLYCRSILTFQC